MRLVLLALFVFTGSVVCINKNENSDQSVLQRRYNFNHPPLAENYNQIPVTVVHEDDVIAEKSGNPENEDDSEPDANIEESHNVKENKQPIISQRIETSTVVLKSITYSEKEDQYVKPKARVLSDFQIPVAVIYDSVPSSTQNSRQSKSNETNISRRRYTKLRRRKQQDELSKEKEKLMNENTEPAKPQSQSEGTIKPQIQNVELVKPQSRRLESDKPEPLKVESVKQNPSSTEKYAKGEETKRERVPFVPIIESENNVYAHSGNFHYSYEGGDGTKAHSEGRLRTVNEKAAGEAVSGGFSYTDKEGNDFSLSYTADENGYRPVGAHLPTPPPIPPAIARALAYLATATTPEPVTKPTVQQTLQH